MKKIFTHIKVLIRKTFGSSNGHSWFVSLQRDMLKLILRLKAQGVKLLNAQKHHDAAQQKIDKFFDVNKDLQVEDLSVDNVNAKRRIKNRIRATSAVDGICGLMATTVLFKVFLNMDLAWIPAMLLGCVVAYWLLLYAMEARIDEQGVVAGKQQPSIGRFVYIIPLIFIPATNLFVILTNPGNPVNILLTGFLLLTLLLNLSTARYYRQYKLMRDTETSNAFIKSLNNERLKHEKSIVTLKQKIGNLADQITISAFDMRSEYVLTKDKPELILSKDQQMFLNSRVYKEDVFPIGQITLTQPAGELAEISRIWDVATKLNIPPANQKLGNTQEESGPNRTATNGSEANHDYANTENSEKTAPEFEDIVDEPVNEDEIIV